MTIHRNARPTPFDRERLVAMVATGTSFALAAPAWTVVLALTNCITTLPSDGSLAPESGRSQIRGR